MNKLNNELDWPVFILGAERSGTTTISHFLHHTLLYKGHREAHVFNLLHKIIKISHQHYINNELSLSHGQEEMSFGAWDSTTADLISYNTINHELCKLWQNIVSRQYKGLWFDKTPGPDIIHCASTLIRMYPNARFIFMIRNPIHSVESNMRKFGNSFIEACDRWKDCAEAWCQVSRHLPTDSYIELKTNQLTSDPDGCIQLILELLKTHPLMLSETKIEHTSIVTQEKTTDGNNIAEDTKLNSTNWTLEQKELFHEKCSALASIFGFELDEDFVDIGQKIIRFPLPIRNNNIEIHHGNSGGVWPQLHDGNMCIFMHPSNEGNITSITYNNFDFFSAGEISISAYMLPEALVSVKFEIKAWEKESNYLIFSQSCVCIPGEKKKLSASIPNKKSNVCIQITTHSVNESVAKAWALISSPVFIPDLV